MFIQDLPIADAEKQHPPEPPRSRVFRVLFDMAIREGAPSGDGPNGEVRPHLSDIGGLLVVRVPMYNRENTVRCYALGGSLPSIGATDAIVYMMYEPDPSHEDVFPIRHDPETDILKDTLDPWYDDSIELTGRLLESLRSVLMVPFTKNPFHAFIAKGAIEEMCGLEPGFDIVFEGGRDAMGFRPRLRVIAHGVEREPVS